MNDLVLTDRAALALIDEAERALAAVDNPEDADDLWRRVKAVEEAARLARVSEATLVTFRRVQLRAKRRYGELLGPAENRGPATVTASDGSTEERREARLHRRMARDLDRDRLGVDTAKHFDDPRALNGGAVPPPPSVERPSTEKRGPRRSSGRTS